MTIPKTIRKVSYRSIPGYYGYSDYNCPCLILQGKWLERDYNIKIGDFVKIIYDKKQRIIIEKEQ